jgi:hypothetical protein
MIIPISTVSTQGYQPLREVLEKTRRRFFAANFGVRPSKLFEGADKRLTILTATCRETAFAVSCTKYHRWVSVERHSLIQRLEYQRVSVDMFSIEGYPKLSSRTEKDILFRLSEHSQPVAEFLSDSGPYLVMYTRKLQYFIQFYTFPPRIYDVDGVLVSPSELKHLRISSSAVRDSLLAILNSNLFFWFFIAFSDCRNVN